MFQKIILGLLFFSLAIPSASAMEKGSLGNQLTPEQKEVISQKKAATEDKINQNYDAFKAALLKRIDRAISMIDKTSQKISGNTKIADASKEVTLSSLANAKKGLESYRAKAEKSTSLDELKAINQEMIKYLKDNKDLIKKNVQNTLSVIGEEVSKKAEEYKKKLMLTLETLKKTCPSEATTIENLEKQLVGLNGQITALKQATKTKNSSEIKRLSAEIKATVRTTAGLVKSPEGKCQL